jgi:hypothetical protein
MVEPAPCRTPGSYKGAIIMSKHEEANLILKLYELRRDETMRKARDWYFRDFHPQSMTDVTNTLFGEHSGYWRMVTSYWEMAATLVNHGAISPDLFNESNTEHISVFAKMEPLLDQLRAAYGQQFMVNLEKLIDAMPNGRERCAQFRERMKSIRAELASRHPQQTVSKN